MIKRLEPVYWKQRLCKAKNQKEGHRLLFFLSVCLYFIYIYREREREREREYVQYSLCVGGWGDGGGGGG